MKELKDGSTKDSVLINGPVGEIIAMRERIFYIDMEDHNVLKSVTYDGRKRKTWTKDPVKQFAVIGEYVICCTEDEKLIRCDMSTGKKSWERLKQMTMLLIFVRSIFITYIRKELPVAGPVDIQKYARKAVTGRFYV